MEMTTKIKWYPIETIPSVPVSEYGWGACERVLLARENDFIGPGYYSQFNGKINSERDGWIKPGTECYPTLWAPIPKVSLDDD